MERKQQIQKYVKQGAHANSAWTARKYIAEGRESEQLLELKVEAGHSALLDQPQGLFSSRPSAFFSGQSRPSLDPKFAGSG